jgi:hypothetical protein
MKKRADPKARLRCDACQPLTLARLEIEGRQRLPGIVADRLRE